MTRDDIIQMMVGREITQMFPKETVPIGEVRLSVKNLSRRRLLDVSFDVRSGEILGFAGLIGSGRSNVAENDLPASPASSGQIRSTAGRRHRPAEDGDPPPHGIPDRGTARTPAASSTCWKHADGADWPQNYAKASFVNQRR